ncbi:hypothetical protein LUZ60_016542 [Juncus effusus]|nr:hypothetical protein LUZ60_016542 [Juncus effusus]
MYGGQHDGGGGGGGAALFSGGGFMPSQATQTPESSASKGRSAGSQTVLPLTIKQISEAYHSNDDKSNFAIDGVEASTIRLLGRVVNKSERITDVSFTLDDGTGKVDVNRWVNESSDTNEMALIENGMYVIITGGLKGFQGKRHIVAFSVRPIVDFNQITLHFLECIHVHLDNTRIKTGATANPVTGKVNATPAPPTPAMNDNRAFQTPKLEPGATTRDIGDLVLNIFQEPASLAHEHGLHVDEIVRRLGLPEEQIRQAIEFHIDIGNVYSTKDDNHFKSACNG